MKSNLNDDLLNFDCFSFYKYITVSYFKKYIYVKSDKNMISDAELAFNLNLIECPFLSSCPLPKIKFLCKIPNCRNCPDYISKSKKVRK